MGLLLVMTSAALLARSDAAAPPARWRSSLAILCGMAAIGCFLGAFLSPPRAER